MSDHLICFVCKTPLGSKRSLRRHIANIHPDTQKISKARPTNGKCTKTVNCPLCDFSSLQHADIMKHFTEVHGLLLTEEAHDFLSTEDFLRWKEEVEKSTKSQFVKVRGSTSIKCIRGKKDVYICHRSGKVRGKLIERVRHTKSQGSQKLNAFCPARMKVVTAEGDRVFLNFLSTHVGHNKDSAHLRLSRTEKEILAKKMASKKPLSEILAETHNSTDDGRLHLLSKQDLQNIVKDPKICNTVFEGCTIENWLATEDRNESVLLFKPIGAIVNEYPELKEDDFALCLTKNVPPYFLTNSDAISLHVFDSNELNLFAVSEVIDGGTVPLMFLLTNKSNLSILFRLLEKFKLCAGALNSKIVFIEENNHFFNAWKMCFGEPNMTIEGSWYAENKCRDALNETVGNKFKKYQLYKTIKNLVSIKEESEFVMKLKEFEEKMSSSEYEHFAKFFKQKISCITQLWARTRHSGDFNEIDKHFGKLHKNFKSIYRRFNSEKTIVPMVSSLWDVVNERMAALNSRSAEVKLIKSRHRTAANAQGEVVQEGDSLWTVYIAGPKSAESHRVERISASHCTCELKCALCQLCKHSFICSCFDFTSKNNMCKHIHLVGMSQSGISNSGGNERENDTGNSVEIVINEGVLSEEVEEGKLEIQLEFNDVLSMITTIEDVNVVKNAFRLIIPTLSALKNANNSQRIANNKLNPDVT